MTALRFQTGGSLRHPRPPFGGYAWKAKTNVKQDAIKTDLNRFILSVLRILGDF